MADILKLGKQQNGIYSICSAHRFVLEAAMIDAQRHDRLIYIESTSNQVDQFGGYTGMTPVDFAGFVHEIARANQVETQRVVLGGDHLGPNVWRGDSAQNAMEKACDLVSAYVKAGYRKIHLDASMGCADDHQKKGKPLDAQIVAQRTALMAESAERSFSELNSDSEKPFYIIGSDVPPPGGALDDLSDLALTKPESVRETIDLTRQAFEAKGLESAWERVVAVVVQPGVEFGDQVIIDYNRQKATVLSSIIETYPHFTYEAHSTDYQNRENLRQMVEDHFTILKVGPWLTFAFREAVFLLELMEKDFLQTNKSIELSHLSKIIDEEMVKDSRYWSKHYSGNPDQLNFSRRFSYSDRIRYYWPNKKIENALSLLINNLTQYPVPLSLLSQYFPFQYTAVRVGRLKNEPIKLIYDKIIEVYNIYDYATMGGSRES
jgi:D-tagatose-1,6-bisphosphate aldolase subunit GatZ/KbaZ